MTKLRHYILALLFTDSEKFLMAKAIDCKRQSLADFKSTKLGSEYSDEDWEYVKLKKIFSTRDYL